MPRQAAGIDHLMVGRSVFVPAAFDRKEPHVECGVVSQHGDRTIADEFGEPRQHVADCRLAEHRLIGDTMNTAGIER